MKEEDSASAMLILMFIPVFIAINGLLTEFNIIDFTYLVLVFFIFAKYYIKEKNKSL